MKLNYRTSLVSFTLLLATCSRTTMVPTTPLSSSQLESSPTSSLPSSYPVPVVIYPTSSSIIYPGPASSEATKSELPPSGYEPQLGDRDLLRCPVFLDIVRSYIDTLSSKPYQVNVILQGYLPDPCYQLRVIVTPLDSNHTINLEVYSVTNPTDVCDAKLEPFIATIPQPIYPSGQYTVMVNGNKLGEFGAAYEPQPGDELLTRGGVFIDRENSKLLTTSTQPIHASVILRGNLPDPCHQLRVVIAPADEIDTINLEVYSVADPMDICISDLQPFDAAISLDSFSNEHIIVNVNGKILGELGINTEPQSGDMSLTRDEVFIDLAKSRLVTTDIQPGQVNVILQGALSDPCHQLRVIVSQPDESYSIKLEVYSLVMQGMVCTAGLKTFEATITLGNFSSGHYIVYVNEQLLGEFDA